MQKRWFFLLFALTIVCFYTCLHGIFFVAPTEAKMGIVQKIFYFHVPAAYAMYLCASICFLGSAHYLARGGDAGDIVAKAAAEITVLFGVIVVVTGPLWAAKAWGAFWTWDPRLTTTLLALVIYIAYLFCAPSAAMAKPKSALRPSSACSGSPICLSSIFGPTMVWPAPNGHHEWRRRS